MLIIPERSMVVILTPRTGSRALKNALLERYPQSFLLYRHMEADGVPFGYDRWQKIGVVRNPIDRLWSLYKYLQTFGDDWTNRENETYIEEMRQSVSVSFEEWLMKNQLPFTTPYDSDGTGRFWPGYAVRHPIPENRKSQFVYLRPDLGTQIVRYDELDSLYQMLDIDQIIRRQNVTKDTSKPFLSVEGMSYIKRWFAWDLCRTN